MLISIVTSFSLFVITICLGMCIYRFIAGPSLPDRVAANDCLSTNIVALFIILSIKFATEVFVDAALVIAILGFLSSVALSKFLIGGSIFDRD